MDHLVTRTATGYPDYGLTIRWKQYVVHGEDTNRVQIHGFPSEQHKQIPVETQSESVLLNKLILYGLLKIYDFS